MSESQQDICAKATGCVDALDGLCPFAVFGRRVNGDDTCPVTGKPVEWRAS
jgi:hypothetical protein